MANLVILQDRHFIVDDVKRNLTDLYFMKVVENSSARNDPSAFSFELFSIQNMNIAEYRAMLEDSSVMLVRINERKRLNNNE